MTVTYTSEVTNSRGFGCFLKLLLRWRGSIYKIVWAELIIFLLLYYFLKIIYEVALDTDSQKSQFRSVVQYCSKYANSIPLTFVLGFYVSLVMTRWWGQYNSIPFPDNLSILIGASIKGADDRARMVRRTIVRYACLAFTATLTMMSPKVKRRFPTKDHLVEAGLLSEDEKQIIEDLDNEFPGYAKYWVPIAWAANIITKSRHEGLIRDDESVNTILEELNHFRSKLREMLDYDWISVPLVYTQVVTIAVYSYFAISLIGKQYVEDDFQVQAYFPLGSVLEFFFYMGWLKVAETLVNPYGDDDDDFEVTWMIDRHLQVSYLLVDKIHEEHPRLIRDQYWTKKAPQQLPHTIASLRSMQEYPIPSTSNITVNDADQDLILPHESEREGIRVAGSLFKRLFGSNACNRHRIKRFPLTRVSMARERNTDHSDTETSDYGLHEKNYTSINTENTSKDDHEFLQLKQKRKEEHLQKLIKNFTLLIEPDSAKRVQIIRELVDAK